MDSFSIQSYKGEYHVHFEDDLFSLIKSEPNDKRFYFVDEHVAYLYSEQLSDLLTEKNHLLIHASEDNKALEKMPDIVNTLAEKGVKRGWHLVAIGGGITQDMCCFIASCLYRGLDWSFYPTTLLAQADSCIGSKSSINCGAFKNIVGTFTPPRQVYINVEFLKTLSRSEIQSGVGEIMKVSLIDQSEFRKKLFEDYDRLFEDYALLAHYIRQALSVKKEFIEKDEFDKSIRNIFNYGHTFGHAIEAATHFGIPHGIAVTIGMDLANYYAYQTKRVSFECFQTAHRVFYKNYNDFIKTPIDFELFLLSLTRDKKNKREGYVMFILPIGGGTIQKQEVALDSDATSCFKDYFEGVLVLSDVQQEALV